MTMPSKNIRMAVSKATTSNNGQIITRKRPKMKVKWMLLLDMARLFGPSLHFIDGFQNLQIQRVTHPEVSLVDQVV